MVLVAPSRLDATAGAGSNNAALAAARAADLVALPCRPTILDHETVASTATRVHDVAQVLRDRCLMAVPPTTSRPTCTRSSMHRLNR